MYIEIGYPKDAVIDVDAQLELTLQNLRRHGILEADNQLETYAAIIMDPAYVHISSDVDGSIKQLKQELAEHGIYTIGRYGGWTYCSMEDCMLEAKKLCMGIQGDE